MDIGINSINGLFILIMIILFSCFSYFKNYIFGILLLLLSIIGCLILFILNEINFSLIYLYIFLIFGFYMISTYFKNNYSIQGLVDHFNLGENDILTYKYLIDQKSKSKKCVINGEYSKKTKYKLNHNFNKDEEYCKSIENNTNLDFIYDK
jgi:hypothetical protein